MSPERYADNRRHSSPPRAAPLGAWPRAVRPWEVERSNGLIHDLGAHAPSYAMPPRCGFCVCSPHSPLLTPDDTQKHVVRSCLPGSGTSARLCHAQDVRPRCPFRCAKRAGSRANWIDTRLVIIARRVMKNPARFALNGKPVRGQ